MLRHASENEVFEADKAQVVKEIATLEPVNQSSDHQRCKVPCL